jgi:hypothetical protein
MPQQNELVVIYNRLKQIMQKYENPLQPKIDLDSKYDLWSFKNVEFAGKMRTEVYFAGLIIQSSYVGFYYMPLYIDESLKRFFPPELFKTLKGKTCFHIKHLDDALAEQIDMALAKGIEFYKEHGWI